MLVTDVRPEGGHQNPLDYEGDIERYSLPRAPARCMFPGEFLSLLQNNLSSRHCSIGVAVSEITNKLRQEVGFSRHGTIWYSTIRKQELGQVIPCDCIPYTSIKTKEWNEAESKWSLDGEIKRGWRQTIAGLVKEGVLVPSWELTFLTGQDTFELCPGKYRR